MNQRKIIKMAYIIFILLIISSVLYIIKFYYDMYNIQKQSLLLNNISVNDTPIEHENGKNERILKLEELQKENSDIVGWLEIENTNINYPVLQGKDNDFYLTHNYEKKKSKGGSIFLDKDYLWNPPSSNLLIYGHNMSNHTMFADLFKYKDKKFYDDNSHIRFTTTYEDAIYEIISVFKTSVYYGSDPNVFEYYTFVNANSKEEYDKFVKNVKKLSFYDTGKTAEYEEQLLTLSTCSYHTNDGRFVVVAKKSNK